MAKKDIFKRRTKGYYKFSKKYPSRRGAVYAIGESRKMKKKERIRKIGLAVSLCCLFVFIYIAALFIHNLISRPLPQTPEENTAPITADNISGIRAVYIENSDLSDMSVLSKALNEAKKNGFNAVMLDFKTKEGNLTFASGGSKYSVTGDNYTVDKTALGRIKQEGFYLIASVYCFEDGVSPQRLGACVYEDPERTRIWFDAPAVSGGRPWLNPASPQAQDYLCTVIRDAANFGADAVYLRSVQFPPERAGTAQYFTEDDSSLNRNLTLMAFIEKAVGAAGRVPVILGMPLLCAEDGDGVLWGGGLFDTAASVCSPLIPAPEDGGYIEAVKEKTDLLDERVKNNFTTIKAIPTVKNQPENPDFYENLSKSGVQSYIIIP